MLQARGGGGGRNCHSGLGVFLGCSVVFSLPRCNPPLFLWESSWEGGRRVFLVFFHLIFLREKREVFPTYSHNKRASTRVHTRNVGVTVLAVSGYMVKNTKAWLPIFLSGLCSHLCVDVLLLQKHRKNPDVNDSRVCNGVTTFRGASIYAWPLLKGFAPCYAPL